MRSERINFLKKRRRRKVIFRIIILILLTIVFLFVYNFLLKSKFKIEDYDYVKGVIYEVVEYKDSYIDNLDVKYGNLIFGYKNVENVKNISNIKIDTDRLGKYNLKYEVKYKNHKKIIKKIVEVKDTKKPIINCFDVDEVHVCGKDNKYNLECKATDNYDGDITSKIEKNFDGDYMVLNVVDSSGNQTSKKVKVTVLDDEKPSIVLKGKTIISIPMGTIYNEQGFISTDNCDGDITDKVEISDDINTNKAGNYSVNYKVKDKSGNVTEAKRLINVYEKSNIPDNKIIYLTFDDGPYKHTARLLDVLKKYNVKATFFVTNQYPGYTSLIKREYEEGHTVGIHTFTHIYSDIYSSVDNYLNDLNKINDLIEEQTGSRSKIVRLPGGSSNTISKNYKQGIMTEVTSELTRLGYTYFDWNCSSGDAGETTDSNQVVSNVISCMESGKTLVVLQHDIKGFSVDAVEDIIKTGVAYGYTFKALDESSYTAHQKILN